MSLRLTLIPCLAAALIFGACDDDKGSGPTSATGKAALLTGTKWKNSAHTVLPGVDYEEDGVLVTNIFAVEGACVHDDVMSLTADGKWSTDEGPSKCDPSDPQIETGTWAMNSAQDSVTITSDIDHQPMKFKLVELSATKWQFSTKSDWDDGVDHVDTFTMIPQ
jgi:hypothetical protein